MARASVGIVTVCYHSMAVLPDMLASVPEGVPVVLVDNAGAEVKEDDGLATLAARHGARLVRNRVNRGFGPACNQGAALLDTEFMLFLNPDAALGEDALEHLLAAGEAYPEASAFNPKIALASGAAQFKRSSVLLPSAEALPRGWPDGDTEVPVLSGAALMVRRTAFEAVGGFDPDIFLYHEDDDLALRLRRDCGPLMFVAGAQVRHLSGRATERSPRTAALKAWHMARSRVYAGAKHGLGRPFARALASAGLQLVSPLVLLSQRKRAKQWAFFRGVLSTWRDGGAGFLAPPGLEHRSAER